MPLLPEPPRAVAAILLLAIDPAGLAAFYRQALGLPLREVRVAGLPAHYACDLGHVYVSIWPTSSAGSAQGGAAFLVRQVQGTFDRLVAAGVEVVWPPRQTPLGTIARLRDPEGNLFELYEPPPTRCKAAPSTGRTATSRKPVATP